MTDGLSSPAPPRFFGVAWMLGATRVQRFALRRASWTSVLVPMAVFSQFVDVLIAQDCIHVIAAGAQRVRTIDHKTVRGHADWHDVHQLKPRDVMSLLALDKPTLLMALKPGANGAWWTRNGVQRPPKRRIAFDVDRPDATRAAVAATLPPSEAARR